jgi:hypothetical protein
MRKKYAAYLGAWALAALVMAGVASASTTRHHRHHGLRTTDVSSMAASAAVHHEPRAHHQPPRAHAARGKGKWYTAWVHVPTKVVRASGRYYAQWECTLGGTVVAAGITFVGLEAPWAIAGILAGGSFTAGCEVGYPHKPTSRAASRGPLARPAGWSSPRASSGVGLPSASHDVQTANRAHSRDCARRRHGSGRAVVDNGCAAAANYHRSSSRDRRSLAHLLAVGVGRARKPLRRLLASSILDSNFEVAPTGVELR